MNNKANDIQSITYKMEMSIPYNICTKVSEKSNIWQAKKDIGAILREMCEIKHVKIHLKT